MPEREGRRQKELVNSALDMLLVGGTCDCAWLQIVACGHNRGNNFPFSALTVHSLH